MAKFRVPVENLPAPNTDGRQLFRFRILSEDRNRSSQYSALFTIESKGQIYPAETTAIASVSASIVTVSWVTPSLYNTGASAVGGTVLHNHGTDWRVHDADVFVSWDGGVFIYYGRSKDSDINIVPPYGISSARVVGQAANYPPTRLEKFTIFDTGTLAVA